MPSVHICVQSILIVACLFKALLDSSIASFFSSILVLHGSMIKRSPAAAATAAAGATAAATAVPVHRYVF